MTYVPSRNWRKRRQEKPYERTGLCQGKDCPVKNEDVPIFRIGTDRYRCAVCFKRETGANP